MTDKIGGERQKYVKAEVDGVSIALTSAFCIFLEHSVSAVKTLRPGVTGV